MHFEHVIIINDPHQALLEPLSRAQLWAGLMWRVEDPIPFQIGLKACEILSRAPGQLERWLDFGSFSLQDTVHFCAPDWVRFETRAEADRPGGTLHISIETPAAETLILRFAYRTTLDIAPGSEAAEYAGFLRAAYQQADIEMARLIRQRATQGSLQ